LLKKARKFALAFKPFAIGLFYGEPFLDLKPRDICCHSFRFKRTWMNLHPTAIKTDEKPHYRVDAITVKMIIPVAFKAAAVALGMNYGVHVVSAVAYGKLCVPESVWGIATSIVTTASPVCSLLLSAMTMTQNNYALILTTTIAAGVGGLLSGAPAVPA
jgi:hypothetical protein